MPGLEANKVWGKTYDWKMHGDEWDDQARFCGQPYERWKDSIAEFFIYPNISSRSDVLEIAPGHGRWTKYLIKEHRSLNLVDFNTECIDFCRKIFSRLNSIEYHVNDGKTLRALPSDSIDFIWSYDSFVHMEVDVITSYISEFHRVLRRNGAAIIHHSGGWQLPKAKGGCRSNISKENISWLARGKGLYIEFQTQTWGNDNEFDCRKFNDFISKIVKP